MAFLPSGLATTASQFDDSPQVRGAVAFGRAVAEAEAFAGMQRFYADIGRIASEHAEAAKRPQGLTREDFDRHAALAVSAAYRSADRR